MTTLRCLYFHDDAERVKIETMLEQAMEPWSRGAKESDRISASRKRLKRRCLFGPKNRQAPRGTFFIGIFFQKHGTRNFRQSNVLFVMGFRSFHWDSWNGLEWVGFLQEKSGE